MEPRPPRGPAQSRPKPARSVAEERAQARVSYEGRHPGRSIVDDGDLPIALAAAKAADLWFRRNVVLVADRVRGEKPLPPVVDLDEWVRTGLERLHAITSELWTNVGEMRSTLRDAKRLGRYDPEAVARVGSHVVRLNRQMAELHALPADRQQWLARPPLPIMRGALEVAYLYERRQKQRPTIAAVVEPIRTAWRSSVDEDVAIPGDEELLSTSLGLAAIARLRPRSDGGRAPDLVLHTFVDEVRRIYQRDPKLRAPKLDDICDLWLWHTSEGPASRVRKLWRDRMSKCLQPLPELDEAETISKSAARRRG